MLINDHTLNAILDAIESRELCEPPTGLNRTELREWNLGLTQDGGHPAALERSQADVNQLLAAVRAVLNVHSPKRLRGDMVVCTGCTTHATFTEYPCKTVTAVGAAFGNDQ